MRHLLGAKAVEEIAARISMRPSLNDCACVCVTVFGCACVCVCVCELRQSVASILCCVLYLFLALAGTDNA